jgi:hypothetical protein
MRAGEANVCSVGEKNTAIARGQRSAHGLYFTRKVR